MKKNCFLLFFVKNDNKDCRERNEIKLNEDFIDRNLFHYLN